MIKLLIIIIITSLNQAATLSVLSEQCKWLLPNFDC